MTAYMVPGAPLQFAPRLVRTPRSPRGPLSTAAVNVPALALLLVVILLVCSVAVVVALARHVVHP